MMRGFTIVSLILLPWLIGCATAGVKPTRSQLEIREFQTRSYDTTDGKMVLKALLNVLQDDGYIVKNANTELGLLVAEKEVDVEKGGEAFFAVFFSGANARWNKSARTEASANVTQYGESCRVRVNFLAKTINNRGEPVKIEKIEDPAFYQEFFSKVDKGIFIQKEGI